MVEYKIGSKKITHKGVKIRAILEIDFQNGLIIYAFPGILSQNDILVKFKDQNIPKSQIRQPKHIHWAVDMLIKKENNPNLSDQFLNSMLQRWNAIKPLTNRQYQTILNNLIVSKDNQFINQFSQLNQYGFFSMEFMTHLIEILMLQEKTNNPNAYMFKDVVDQILKFKDLYAIISKATHRRNK